MPCVENCHRPGRDDGKAKNSLNELSEKGDLTLSNLSIFKNREGKSHSF